MIPPITGPFGGYLSGRSGRRPAMLFASLLFGLAYALMASAVNVYMLLLGRLVSGVASGVTSVAVTVYVAETASASVRGTLGSMFQVFEQ